jgi:KDO2-lipid IV(A) lauroyltransferase
MTETKVPNSPKKAEKKVVTKDNTHFELAFLHPKNWPLLCGVSLLWLVSLLPIAVQQPIGRGIGRLVSKLLPRRLKIAQQNLALSFPDKSTAEVNSLAKQNFEYTGLAVVDTANAWFWPDWRIQKNMVVEGQEHIEAAKAAGNGMLLLSAHFLTLEICARTFGQIKPGVGVYRPNKNPLMEYLQCRGRTRSNKALLDRRDVKGMLKALNDGDALWYAPDHDYGVRRSVFVPLFAVEKACTITGTTMLSAGRNTKTYPCFSSRMADGRYKLMIKAPLENFPTRDLEQDAITCNKVLEEAILEQLPQYMWLHRRYKTRPEGEASLYK